MFPMQGDWGSIPGRGTSSQIPQLRVLKLQLGAGTRQGAREVVSRRGVWGTEATALLSWPLSGH